MREDPSAILERMDRRFTRIPIGDWPTPVGPLEIPGRKGDDLWIKRDDLSSRVYGGNKVRKLEYLLAGSAAPVVTFGGSGSHHVLATALHGAQVGRECVAFVVKQPATRHSMRMLELNRAACSALIELPPALGSAIRIGKDAARVLAGIGLGRYAVIPPGGSSPLGTLGYVRAGLELARQVSRGECPEPARIFLPLGSGGTAAGLALGLALAGMETSVIAVRVATVAAGNLAHLRLLARRTHRLLCRDPGDLAGPMNLRILHGFAGAGYGHPTDEGAAAMVRAEGITLDPTYTAKAMAAMLHHLETAEPAGPTMFLDTYGPMEDVIPRVSKTGRRS